MSLIIIQGVEEKKAGIHYEVDPSIPSLGEGGMGKVLRGVRVNEKNGTKQDVAIKFLFEDLPTHAIERARREASIQIHNENLVEMFGFIEVVENPQSEKPLKRYHVVSELLEGVMLFDLLNGKTTDRYGQEVEFAKELYTKYLNNRFDFAVFIVKNVLSGIMALHDKGYIHRDLDPSNIMITADRKVKIIDFGIAKQLNSLNTYDQQLTSSGQFIGKAAYAAPELVLGDVHNQNKTTDIYAVGVMLFQFIVGKLPFEGTMAELIDQQLHGKMPLKLVPFKSVRRIIEKATAKKQGDRYQSAVEMRVDLDHLTKADAIPSKTFSGTIPLQANGKNKKKMLGIAAAVAAVVLAAVAIPLFVNHGPSEEDLAQARIDSLYKVRNGSVVDSGRRDVIVDPETKAKMTPVGSLVAKAVSNLQDPAHTKEGVSQLMEIVTKYGTYKNVSEALALLAGITQPADAEVSPAALKSMRQQTASLVTRDAAKAHQYAEQAVQLDATNYKALFELATDYVAGEVRTGDATMQNARKSLDLFLEGLKYAEKEKDSVYIKLYNVRIHQVSNLVEPGE